MGIWVSISLPMVLRGRAVSIELHDHYIQDGELDGDDYAAPDELVFDYKVYDIEEDAQVMALTDEERALIREQIIADLQNICR
jgi:hypothetical protein